MCEALGYFIPPREAYVMVRIPTPWDPFCFAFGLLVWSGRLWGLPLSPHVIYIKKQQKYNKWLGSYVSEPSQPTQNDTKALTFTLFLALMVTGRQNLAILDCLERKQQKVNKNTSRVILQLYQEHINNNDIQNILESKKSIKRYAWILHDKDNSKPHYHIMIDFGRSYPVDRIPEWFDQHPGIVESNLMEPVKSWTAFVQYLIHKNDPDKYQYDITEIVSNYDLTEDLEAPRDTTPAWFGDFGQVEYMDHLSWINQNTPNIYKANKLFDAVNKRYKYYLIAREETEREVKVIFVEGVPGIGKTTFAKWYAVKNLKKSYFISGSSNDPLDGYSGQGVLILDDLRDHVWSLTDLLKILDNHTGSLIKSRYYNKRFDGSHIIITSTVPLCDWYKGPSNSTESLAQLYRRVNDYVFLEPGQGLYYRKVSKETGRPLEDLTTESIPWDPTILFDQLRQSVQDDREVSDTINKLKETMSNGKV